MQIALHEPDGEHVQRGAAALALAQAVNVWNQVPCAAAGVRYRGKTHLRPNVDPDGADGMSVVGFETQQWPFGEGVTALTRLRLLKGAIVEADMLINAVDYEWRAGAVPASSRRLRSLEPTLAHELGHALGLGHAQHARSVMHASAQHQELSADDVRGICELYPTALRDPGASQTASPWATGGAVLAFVFISAGVYVRRRWLRSRP